MLAVGRGPVRGESLVDVVNYGRVKASRGHTLSGLQEWLREVQPSFHTSGSSGPTNVSVNEVAKFFLDTNENDHFCS